MAGPLLNLIIFVVVTGLAFVLFRPRGGLLTGRRREKAIAGRMLLEDALKHIYNHEAREKTTTLESVAGALEIPQARALSLVEKMQDAGLSKVIDGRIVLIEEGKRYALQVIRAHRLWERYLADETGVDALEWHSKAERQEHLMTPDETDALAEKLGNPRFDPHGDPIPTADGVVPDEKVSLLSELSVGDTAHVAHIEDEPDVVYAQLVALGVYLGMVLRVETKTDQRFVFEADGRKFVLAPIVAANVSVRRLELDDAIHEEPAPGLTLAALAHGEQVQVVRISPACRGIERRRLMDLGIVPGTTIEFERPGLSGGLRAYRVRGTLIALREEQSAMIAVTKPEEAAQL